MKEISGVSMLCRKKLPFEADRRDGIFALFAFVLGFLFARWVLSAWQGWGVTFFTLLYFASVTLYFRKKGVLMPRTAWFWLAAVVLIGLSYSLWNNNGLEPWRNLFLFCGAVYWVISATGIPILGKTSNWMILDGINGVLAIPFRNFVCQYKSLSYLGRKKRTAGGQVLSIALGILFALLVVGIVLPLLMKADSGGFSRITKGIMEYLEVMQKNAGDFILQSILAVPIAAYLFGLVAGSVHQRGCDTFKKEDIQNTVSALRILPSVTVYIVLGSVCALYVVFIGTQLPYFFSGFAGLRPAGWQIFSEYARSGFFELCQIAAINLSLLAAANILCKKPRQNSIALKIFNIVLALLTLLLIATALSKMIMYIDVYGLSVRRLLPCVFMIFLAIICGAVATLQKWQFSILRLAAVVGTVLLCVLCLMGPDGFVARYNADRYMEGTLSSFDVEILYLAGPAGVEPALEVYAGTDDKFLRTRIEDYLIFQQKRAAASSRKSADNLENARARQQIAEFTEAR